MNISLYNISQKQNVANKIKNASPVYTGDVSPYMGVTNKGASFILDKGYTCNYGVYTFLGKSYYCYVNTSVNSDGLYLYEFNIDALATCYYNGAFNSNQYVVRDKDGDPSLYDAEEPHNPFLSKYVYDLPDTTGDVSVIMNVLLPINNYVKTENEHYVSNRNITSYVMTPFNYAVFVSNLLTMSSDNNNPYNLGDNDVPNLVKSILSVYVVDNQYINNDMLIDPTDPYFVRLYKINTAETFTHTAVQYLGIFVPNGVKRLKRHINNSFDLCTNSYKLNFGTAFNNISPELLSSTINVYVRNIGNISFKLADVGVKDSLTSLGYSVGVNYTGGTVTAFLEINGVVHKDYKVVAQLREQALLPFDSSVALWTDYTGSVLSTIGGGVSTGVGIATANPLAIYGGIAAMTSGVSGIVQTQTSHELGGYSIIGSLGGYDDFQLNVKNSFITFLIQEPIVNNNYQSLFGKPQNKIKNISTLTGYIRTQKCKFNVSLPFDIVTEGETIVDSGIYVV